MLPYAFLDHPHGTSSFIFRKLFHILCLMATKFMAWFREGAGDCSSCVAVMLELARGISQWAHGFKHAVIFLFNTGEEEGLNGAHSFVTQVSIILY